jgi:hypothetical protein
MGEDDAKVSLVAGSEAEEGFEARDEHEAECEYEHEYEWEYEDGGLWVGTVGAVEVEWGKETPVIIDALASVCSDNRPGERGTSEQNEEGGDFQVEGDLTEEAAEDEWSDLRAGPPTPRTWGSAPCRPSPLTASPAKHRGSVSQLQQESSGPGRSRSQLRISSGRRPGSTPG